jgi:hypothetical protein
VSVGPPPATAHQESRSWSSVSAAIFLLVFGFLPLVNWIPGGRQAPWYPIAVGGWLSGSAIVLGATVLLLIVARRVPVLRAEAWLEHPRVGRIAESGFTGAAVAALALLLYVLLARLVFSARPLVIEEVV